MIDEGVDNYIQATQEANNATDPPKKIVNPTDNTRVASKAVPSKGKLTSNYFQEANNKAYWKDFYAKKDMLKNSPDGLTVSGWKNMQNGTWKKGNKVVKDDDMQVVNGVLQPKKTPKF